MDQVTDGTEERPGAVLGQVAGTILRVRPIGEEDAPYLVDLFEHMSPESRFLRFNVSLIDPDTELVWREARRLAAVDSEQDGAWLVLADLPDQPGAAIAGARYIRVDEEMAEASIAVRDDWQRRGIGTMLLRYLVNQAREAGIRRLMATIQRANRPIWALVRRSGLPYSAEYEGSSATIVVELDRG